nr:tetratricopeptide repeat protein [uncultured Sphingomonas sp.]
MILFAAALIIAAPSSGPAKPIAYPEVVSATCGVGEEPDDITCRALDAERRGDFAGSAGQFEKLAARLGDSEPVRRDRAYSAAGNMWIAGGRPTEAGAALDKAIKGGTLTGQQLGLAQLDRARAAEAAGDLKTARTMVRGATVTIPDDPFLYYFSAVLAKRENDLPGARSAINRALSMAPNSSELLLEAGNIADLSGDKDAAKQFWNRAIAAGATSAAGQTAQANLNSQSVPLTVTNHVTARPDGDGEGQDQPQN